MRYARNRGRVIRKLGEKTKRVKLDPRNPEREGRAICPALTIRVVSVFVSAPETKWFTVWFPMR
jgi:hypothetical protein